MASFAEQCFLIEARMARIGGCLFVPNAWRSVAFERFEVVLRSWYSAYVGLSALGAVMLEGYLLSIRMSGLSTDVEEDFFEMLYVALHILGAIKILNNLTFMFAGKRVLVEALQDVKRLERSIGFRFKEEGGAFWWKRRLRLFVFAAILFWLGLSRAVAVAGVAKETVAPWLPAMAIGVYSLLYGVIESMVVIVERYFCVVLSRYVQFQLNRAQELVGNTGLAPLRRQQRTTRHLSAAVDSIRASMAAVAKIVRKVDGWLGIAVVVNFVASTLAVCVMVYAVVATHISTDKLWATGAYTTLTCLSVADASYTAGDIKKQALKMKAMLNSASVLGLPLGVTSQVEIFSMTIDEKELCFTGTGFFAVDKPLLTTFIGLVMTYSIIVVQTGRKS